MTNRQIDVSQMPYQSWTIIAIPSSTGCRRNRAHGATDHSNRISQSLRCKLSRPIFIGSHTL